MTKLKVCGRKLSLYILRYRRSIYIEEQENYKNNNQGEEYITPCSPSEINQRFGGMSHLHLHGLINGAKDQRGS
jgi:hypothetical protein